MAWLIAVYALRRCRAGTGWRLRPSMDRQGKFERAFRLRALPRTSLLLWPCSDALSRVFFNLLLRALSCLSRLFIPGCHHLSQIINSEPTCLKQMSNQRAQIVEGTAPASGNAETFILSQWLVKQYSNATRAFHERRTSVQTSHVRTPNRCHPTAPAYSLDIFSIPILQCSETTNRQLRR
jgi:hypothetical protein